MNDSSITQKNDANELAWLAEQYVLGELDPTARDSLEARLSVDQSAREAVAKAMMLVATAHASQISNPLVSLRSARGMAAVWNSRIWWLVGTAAAIFVGGLVATQGNWFETDSDKAFAMAWIDTREAEGPMDSGDELATSVESGTASGEEIEAPDWLITAMSLHQEGIPKEEGAAPKPSSGEGA